ncbi:MAG: type II CAAX endopeptidase family protein [Candidatus Bathyarchaeia archaeon]
MATLDVMKALLVYYGVAALILVTAYYIFASTLLASEVPVILSILLLFPVYWWQKNYRAKGFVAKEVGVRSKSIVLFSIVMLFVLALTVRIPSVLWFAQPYEKTPLIYLLVLTMLLVERTDLSVFGFKTEKLARSLAYGLVIIVVLAGVSWSITYGLIYVLTGQMPLQGFDILIFLLSMPFMTLCVGISEEGLFRGYMQTHLEKFYGSGAAVFWQALLFGLWHFVWDLSPFNPFGMILYVTSTFLFGLLFGYVYRKVRTLVPLVFAHGLWNSCVSAIIENPEAMNVFGTFSLGIWLAVSFLPYILAVIVTVLLFKILCKEK